MVDVKCKKSIFSEFLCDFRKHLTYEAEITKNNKMIIIDNHGEIHDYQYEEWKNIFELVSN